MAEHLYEYRLVTMYLSPKPGELPDYTDPKTHKILTQHLGKSVSQLPKIISNMPKGNGWTVNSHSMTFIGGTVVLSILIQRLKTQTLIDNAATGE
jgi:hypothetical protein